MHECTKTNLNCFQQYFNQILNIKTTVTGKNFFRLFIEVGSFRTVLVTDPEIIKVGTN